MDILMLLSLIGFFIISLCVILHGTQHFRCRCCIKYKYRISTLSSYTTNNSGFNTRNKHNSITNHTHRRSTNNMTPVSHLRVSRVSNSMNLPPVKQKWHHRTLSSLYENRFTASISSFRASINSIAGPDHKLVKRKCQFCVFGAEEDFDFFPSAYLLYIIFMICMILTFIVRSIIIDGVPLFYGAIHNNINNIHNDIFWVLLNTKLSTSSFQTMSTIDTHTLFPLDWILAYCIMLLSACESLFNFYRYYTTMYAARYFYSIETKYVLKKYTYYFIAYCILFAANIHLYYWLFPITILTHFTFNTYCTFMFAHILVVQYKHIISTDSFLTDVHDEMLSSVYLMRKFSMFSSILSSIYLAILLISYTVDTIKYLPILWSLCALSFTLNFVRNRQFILRQFYKVQHCLIIKNFSCISRCLDLKNKMCKSTKNATKIDAKNANNKSTKATTENGRIADLKRQRKHNNNLHIAQLKLRNDSTLSFTAPTPQNVTSHLTNVMNGTHRNLSALSIASTVETLPTLKERGLTIKPISMISEISGDIGGEEEEDDDEMVRIDADDDDDTIINEEDNDCFGTPSSMDINEEVSDSPIIDIDEQRIYQVNHEKKHNSHKISITAPDAFRRRNAFVPTPIRTRSATLNTPSSKSVIEAICESRIEGEELAASALQKAQSDNLVRKSVSCNKRKTIVINDNMYTKESISTAKRFAPHKDMHSQPNYRYYKHHNISPLVVKSCGHTPQSNNSGKKLWNPPKQSEIPPIDLMLDIQYDDEIVMHNIQDISVEDGDHENDSYESASCNITFDNDLSENNDNDTYTENMVMDHMDADPPTTPSRKCKALKLLGISSNESSVMSNMAFSEKKKSSRRNILKNYGSYSANKSSKMMALRHKLSKSKSSVANKRGNVPHSNPVFKQRALTKSSSQHLGKKYRNKMQKMKSNNLGAEELRSKKHRRNVTMSNGHTPESQSNVANIVSKHWYHDYIRSRAEKTKANEAFSNKSFSKTLTQSELRDIVYEENDIILMETIKQQQLADNQQQTRDSIISCNTPHAHNPIQLIGSKVSTRSECSSSIHPQIYNHSCNAFGSDSYHSLNARTYTNTNTLSLNTRIFELLDVDHQSTCDPPPKHEHQLQTSSLPPKIYDNYVYDHVIDGADNEALDLRKAFSMPQDTSNNNNNNNNSEQNNINEANHMDVNMDEDDAYNVMVDIHELQSRRHFHEHDDNDEEEVDDATLIRNMLVFDDDANNNANNGDNDSSDDDIEGERGDFFPLDVEYVDRLRKSMQFKYGMSHSLFDEINGRFAPIQSQPKQHSMSVSSKSVKSRRMTMNELFNESVRKRRSRSMPSMEAVNNDSNDSLFEHTENEEQGDIISLLSVLVQHGLYSKKNLNSVQQLTHYKQ